MQHKMLFIVAVSVLASCIHGDFVPVPPYNLIDDFAEVAIWESLGPSKEDDSLLPDKTDYTQSVYFRLYTRSDPAVGSDLPTDPQSLLTSDIDPEAPTKIFVFGFQNVLRSDSVLTMKNAYLQKGDYNFVVVDWSELAAGPNYIASRSHTVGVANLTAKFLDALAESKICLPENQHIIGHSLGAQIAGMASRTAKTKPGRCTGLDPAGPLYELSTAEGRIDPSVATLVDIIHSSAGTWGLPSPVGHIDFYPNGGTWPQPDCIGNIDDIDGLCSHTISFEYFAYSINHPNAFVGHRCQTPGIIRGQCPDTSETAIMGEHVDFKVPGLYYLQARVNLSEPHPLQSS